MNNAISRVKVAFTPLVSNNSGAYLQHNCIAVGKYYITIQTNYSSHLKWNIKSDQTKHTNFPSWQRKQLMSKWLFYWWINKLYVKSRSLKIIETISL